MKLTPGAQGLVIVAHPDDELIWVGGIILSNPEVNWRIVVMCGNDVGTREKFFNCAKAMNAEAVAYHCDSWVNESDIDISKMEKNIIEVVDSFHGFSTIWDYIFTHDVLGEYTRNWRHEEISRAVLKLWTCGKLKSKELYRFAYTDNKWASFPKPKLNADLAIELSEEVYKKKLNLLSSIYGFNPWDFEVKSSSKTEAVWYGDWL